jgi:acyl dehydratase
MRYASHTFDDLALQASFEAGPRVVTREDIATFARLSGDHTALHTDPDYAASTPLGGLVAHGVLNLAVATGLAFEMGIFEGTILAFRGIEVRFDRPVQPGDALSLRLTVARLDERPRPGRGAVTFDVDLSNQGGRTVLSGSWAMLMARRPSA